MGHVGCNAHSDCGRTLRDVQRPSLPQSLGLLVAVSLVAGILTAGMSLPFVGGVGLGARSATNDFVSLPAILKAKPLPQLSTIVADDGTTKIATFYSQDRINEPLSAIPMRMQQALIDVEDVRFYEHGGVDFKGTLRALLHNGSSTSGVQGGSTLTQQYVKNVLLQNATTKKAREAATADNLTRKIKEARLAIGLEQIESKSEILDNYFNIAYFGDGAYGIGAAAKHFFKEKVQNLTLDQSALLAGLVQSPAAYNPRYYPQAATTRRNIVLGQMLKYHSITQVQYTRAVARPIHLVIKNEPNDCASTTVASYGYFCEYVKDYFKITPGLGLSLLRRGGLTVTTTLDPKIQAAAQAGIKGYVFPKEPDHVASAEAVVQPGTGDVKALAVSTPYGNDAKKGQNSEDYAVDEKYGGSPGFHAGSTFKLFVLTAALKEGIPITTSINAKGTMDIQGYTTCNGQSAGDYPVSNDDPAASKNYNLATGTWYSVNTFYAQLELRTGICTPVKLAEEMGVTQGTGKPPEQVPSFVLGSGATYGFSPLDVAGAYATIANHGKYCPPVVITSIVDRSGHSYPLPKERCKTVVPPGLADTVTSIMEGDLTQPGATATSDQLTDRPAAAKTGTVDNYDGSWFAGFTPQLASAVWTGVPRSSQQTLEGLTFGGRLYDFPVFGATVSGKIWQATMNAALQGQPVAELPPPDPFYANGLTTSVPPVDGDSVSDATSQIDGAGFTAAVETTAVNSNEPLGTVAFTSPGGGTSAASGTTVEIFVSNGVAPKPTITPSKKPSSPPPTGPAGGKSSPPVTPPVSPTITPPVSPSTHPTHSPGHEPKRHRHRHR
jgi:membrane peptidoglycan carboxypeptidase